MSTRIVDTPNRKYHDINFFTKLLRKHLPRKVKRVMLIGTLFRYIARFRNKNFHYMSDVQNQAHCTNYLECFFLSLFTNIWSNRVHKDEDKLKEWFKSEEYEINYHLTDYFLERVPKWIKYGTKSLIEHDIFYAILETREHTRESTR